MNFDPRNLLSAPKIYQLFDNLIGGTNARKRLIREFLKTGVRDNILDVGCGPGSMRKFLLCETYCGIDISSKYISAARQQNDRDRFIVRAVTDKTSLKDLGKFDLVIAIGFLHHLNDGELISLFAAAKEVLNPGGRVVTLDNVFVAEQSIMARWIISLDRGKHVRTKEAYAALARQQFQQVRTTILHDLIRIPYTHIVMECR